MYFTYILYSKSLDKYYVGSTADMAGRLRRHNSDHEGFTGRTPDWEVKWTEQFNNKPEAESKEKQIKCWKSRKMIGKLIAEV